MSFFLSNFVYEREVSMQMRNKSLFTAIFLGFVCLSTIMLMQYVWIKKTIVVQQTETKIHIKKDSLNNVIFAQKVHFSLEKVLNEISNLSEDKSDKYGAIQQVEDNIFLVYYNGSIEPYFLANTLKKEFYKMQIKNDFQFALYNCFNDSTYYSFLYQYTLDSLFINTHIPIKQPPLKNIKKNESHYFTVYFPTYITEKFTTTEDLSSPWFFLVVVSLLILIYLTYSVIVIERQKKLADIKTDFINNMTHELKTPIATIGLSSTTLMNEDFTDNPDRLRKYAGIIFRENKRLESQVERVLNVAKMSKNSTPLNKTLFDIHEFLLESQETFEINIEENGGTLHLQLEASQHQILADIVHVKNIIYNLIDNAIKYQSEKRALELIIRTYNAKKKLIIEISDNGIGISKENLKYIFDKFYRVPTGDIHNVKGFGLGLYYVRTIVNQHEGTVTIKSEKDKGTVFTIVFPLK